MKLRRTLKKWREEPKQSFFELYNLKEPKPPPGFHYENRGWGLARVLVCDEPAPMSPEFRKRLQKFVHEDE